MMNACSSMLSLSDTRSKRFPAAKLYHPPSSSRFDDRYNQKRSTIFCETPGELTLSLLRRRELTMTYTPKRTRNMGPVNPQLETPRRSGVSEYLLLEHAPGEIPKLGPSGFVRRQYLVGRKIGSRILFLDLISSVFGDFGP